MVGHACAILTGNNAEAAFQKYTLLPANLIASIPEIMSFDTAAVLPLSVSCAAAALYEKDALSLPLPQADKMNANANGQGDSAEKTILIWGGSSSVGSSAIQLARSSGLRVIATASEKHFDRAKDLGAAAVYDYRSPHVVADLVKVLQGSTCLGAFDTTGANVQDCAEILSQLGGGHVVATADPPKTLPEGVTANHGEQYLTEAALLQHWC